MMKDLHNLLQKITQLSRGGLSEDEILINTLKDFSSVAGNYCTVHQDSNSVAKTISITSNHMIKMFDMFPEVVLVDTTFNTNKNGYKLFSMMIHDSFGKGQHVQHSLMERETKSCFRNAFDHFKKYNDYSKIKVFITDKDFTEIECLEQNFPSARVLLCQFHVLKWLKQHIHHERFGNLSQSTKDHIYCAIYYMVYAKNEETYQFSKAYMEDILQNNNTCFLEYFNQNWDNCKERWCSFLRQDVPNLCKKLCILFFINSLLIFLLECH